eukprot:350760-Heterocapsa_arctica.AAC.1
MGQLRDYESRLHDALRFIRWTLFRDLPPQEHKGKGKGKSNGSSLDLDPAMQGPGSSADVLLTWERFI